MILDIIKFNNDPNNILKSNNIDVIKESKYKILVSDMFETLKFYKGVGLAAPQVGKNLNLFVVSYEGFKEIFINPKIEPFGFKVQMDEGCLSVPNIPITMRRSQSVFIQYYDNNWNFKENKFDGMLARIIQHEYDHLIGKLIID